MNSINFYGKNMRFILLLIAILSISACSKQVKEKIGIETTGPNEYNVTRNKPLEVPPHYDLPLPNMDKENIKTKNE